MAGSVRLAAVARQLMAAAPYTAQRPHGAQRSAAITVASTIEGTQWLGGGPEGALKLRALSGPQQMGAEVHGFSIRHALAAGWGAPGPTATSPGALGMLREALVSHGLLLFRGQLPRLSAEELVAFARWWGSGVLHAAHHVHPCAEHRDVFRVSNDPDVGCWEDGGVGTAGFHNDGAFMPAPYSHAIYQIVEAPSPPPTASSPNCGTAFLNVNKALSQFAANAGHAALGRLAALHTVSDVTGLEHPLLFTHPLTGRALLLSGGWRGVLRLDRTAQPDAGVQKRALRGDELRHVKRTVQELLSACDDCVYAHRWQAGDVIVTDNLAVMHRAEAGAGLPPSVLGGLRVLHRVTVAGTHVLGEGTVLLASEAAAAEEEDSL